MSAVDDLLAATRSTLDRVAPADLVRLRDEGALVVDIRPVADRVAEGEIPGAVPVERIHLEWRLDPSSPHRLPQVREDRVVVVVCNEGYASSLAAAILRELGLRRATDLIGGFRAWRAAGLPTRPGGTPPIP
ncbi:Rhodanese-related sulfurtransferase [Amycolatopsis arida]|uniref:Rhodanese-related sulfurtransferase n=1 Tax=Amycolatopsis arida TaxID=587909 RepID=A0A1I5PAE8_9PSEU|nr:rhodanese-like domain-containing protein [Amycolatopsis arida]TDX98425.1 rhodanese-related sulfurtransferase [Amycolatopsis arida]SFP31074.1 Rhodanese-related sulfurtransferase [Amycolatopsis arida]